MITIKNVQNVRKEVITVIQLFAIFLLSLLIMSAKLHSEQVCDLAAYPFFPPTPYTNAFLKFDGKGDFLRTNDIDELEFDTTSSNNIVIETAFKIDKPLSPQYVLGKYYGKGWILGYHTDESGYVSVTFSSGWKRVYYLGSDTSWHSYKITYDKNTRTLNTYVDGNLTYSYSNFIYGGISNPSAFSVGNVGFLAQYGPQSVNLYTNWLKGSVDFIKVKVNSVSIIDYDFNECSGQFAKDSASYYINDRTYPGEYSCGAKHLMLGFNPTEDTCDPSWILDDIDKPTDFSAMGTGLRTISVNNGFETVMQSSSTGMTVWNGYLVNCGTFNKAGGNTVKNIAKWNGDTWSGIGNGFNYEPVQVLNHNGELYATGFFDTAIGFGETKYIAKWDGTQWSPLGRGLNDVGLTMTEYNGDLIAGGYFVSAGEVYSPGVARWDGNEWHSLAQGVLGAVYALCVYNGELYAGGSFIYAGTQSCNGIAKWNGSQWLPVGTGMVGGERVVRTLKVYNGELYAGGSFIYMNGVHCSNIAKYDGTVWRDLNGGAKGYGCTSSLGYVTDLEVLNNELYTIGLFTRIGGLSANKIAKWNGNNWCSIEFGLDLLPRDLTVYNNSLIINGDFLSVSGKNHNNIVKYTPKTFTGNNNYQLPANFGLSQNYPNPFNPNTAIVFEIPSTGLVTLVVFDVTGREISTPVNETMQAGKHHVNFDGSMLSSGVYFYRLSVTNSEGNNFNETKKMLLVK